MMKNKKTRSLTRVLCFEPNTCHLSLVVVAMEAEGGGLSTPSYSSVTAKENNSNHSKRSIFELPDGMQQIIWEEEISKEKPMEVDP
jgi:hypothetical protein